MTTETIKKTVFVHVNAADPDLRYPTFREYDASAYGYVLVGLAEIELQVNREQTITNAVTARRAKAQKERAEGEARAQELEELAQKLLALPAPTGVEILDAS